MKTSEWAEIRLFISSTFNDMHAERDYLVTEVFPVLREWCEARRIRLTDIDLRWGITGDNPEMKNTVLTCLRCVDECRPFFLCFAGQRRGWVPDLEKYASGDDVSEYEGLADRLGKRSITEMEIEHAVLAPMVHILSGERSKPERCRALFFFREDPFRQGRLLTEEQRRIYTNAAAKREAEEDLRLHEFKQRIEEGWQVHHYTCRWDSKIVTEELRSLGAVSQGRLTDFTCEGKPLRDCILSELERMIAHEFPDHQPKSVSDPYDEDALEQHLLAQTSCFDFVGRDAELRRIRAFLEGDGDDTEKAFFIASAEGLGSTALLGKIWAEQPLTGRNIIMRSCGMTDRSSTNDELYLSIGNEGGVFRASELDPREKKYLGGEFFTKLMDNGWNTLILDGIEKLQSEVVLPHIDFIPEGFRLIVSSANPENFQNQDIPCVRMTLTGLQDPEDRLQMIRTFLKRSLKSLSREQENHLISSDAAAIPMYLKIACSELKNYGSYSDLTKKVRRFGSTLEDAFAEVLQSVEEEWDENRTIFPELAGLFCFARDGLDEDELLRGLEDLGFSGEAVQYRTRMLLRRLQPYLSRVNGRYSIMSRTMHRTMWQKYAGREETCRRVLIRVYTCNLKAIPNPAPNEGVNEAHGSRELLYQYVMLLDREGLRRMMLDDTLFSKIPPNMYLCDYKNGLWFSMDKNIDYGFADESPARARNRYRLLAEALLEMAQNNLGEAIRNYPGDKAAHCQKLRQKADQTEFYRYRDLYYEMTGYACAALLFQKRALEGAESLEELLALEQEYRRFADSSTAKNIYSFMSFLDVTGADALDLSHNIEYQGSRSLDAEKDIEKFIRSEKQRLNPDL